MWGTVGLGQRELMQQQVSSCLLQGFICQKDPPSVRGRAWQRYSRKQHLQERDAALSLAFQSEPWNCPKHRPSAHTHLMVPASPVRGWLTVTPDLFDTRLGKEPIQSLLCFPGNPFMKTFRLCMYQSHTFRGRRTQSSYLDLGHA